MNKLTYGDVKSVIAKASGICLTPTSRVAGYLNEATQRLMNRGKWVGTYGRYQICITDGCITWPRQIQTIEAYAVCNTPGIIRNEWFEFLESGPGLLDSSNGCSSVLVDRGMAPVFTDITRGQTNRKVRVYSDIAESAGLKIVVQGYDENGNWIRTQPDGVNYIDGESILLAVSPGTISSKFFSAVTGVIKPVTNGFVRLYEYNNTTSANVRVMAIYEPDETLPNYRRSLIPGVSADGGSCDGQTKLTVMAKLRFVPVSGSDDNQWVMLGNLAALKLAVQGIVFEEKNMPEQAEIYLLKAVRELERELEVYQGDGVVAVPRVMSSDCWGGGGIGNINSYIG